MKETTVVNAEKATIENLHSSSNKDGGFEFHNRVIVCWLYSLLFIYRCIKGSHVRLLFNSSYVHSEFVDDIPPGDRISVNAFESARVEKMWSGKNILKRLFIAPLYGIYIVIHTIIGSNITFISSPDEDAYLSSGIYYKSNNYVVVTEIIE